MVTFPYQFVASAINHVLINEHWAKEKLLPFVGQSARIDLGSLQIFLTIKTDGLFEASSNLSNQPAVIISLPNDTPFRLISGELSAIFSTARLSGSAELAEALAFVFRNIEWDIESDLADLIGDVPASRALLTLKAFANWQKSSVMNVAQNFKEFITDESRQIISQMEIAAFGQAVNTLRDDLERLDKRISRLNS